MSSHESGAVGAAKSTRLLALDPGGTTGYAAGILISPITRIVYDQAKLNENQLYAMLEELQPDHIICEDFEYRNRARAGLDLTPPRLIGVVRLYGAHTGARVHMQKAAKGKGFYTDDKLKKLDLYIKGRPHGRDALRHLLHWLTFGVGYGLAGDPQFILEGKEWVN
jgi:hypothetical protein